MVKTRKEYSELKQESESALMKLKQDKYDLQEKIERLEQRLENKGLFEGHEEEHMVDNSPTAPPSYFWDKELSLEISEMRSKLENIRILEQMNCEKETMLKNTLDNLSQSNQKVQRLESEVTELKRRLMVIGQQTDPQMVHALKTQCDIYLEDFKAESKAKVRLLCLLQQVTNRSINDHSGGVFKGDPQIAT